MRRGIQRVSAGAAVILLIGGVTVSSASGQATANATAAVLVEVIALAPLTATTVNDLDFGSITTGTTGTVAAADAARFQITGEPSFPVAVTFLLPATLVGPGAATIDIVFAATDGLLWDPFPTTFTTFDPAGTLNTNLDPGGNLEVGVRGSVSPPIGTTPGAYAGTITVTVSY